MNSRKNRTFFDWIGMLCGQEQEPGRSEYLKTIPNKFPEDGLGRSQLNELLLASVLDRVEKAFFKFVFNGDSVPNFRSFRDCITNFRIKGAIKYGNFKYAFKYLRDKSESEIESEFSEITRRDRKEFKKRHSPLVKIKKILPELTYYLGYIVEEEIQEKMDKAPQNEKNKLRKILKEKIPKIQKKGKFNHDVYMDYDHMDVYVATSMRRKIDYWNVARFVEKVFSSNILSPLNLRYFDPTQAYCPNRMDKGLVEGLMLKRARCTIYMAGEAESLGKDSELAATLAQGKPVIAYVPKLKDFREFYDDYVIPTLRKLYAGEDKTKVAKEFLKIYYPEGAWDDPKIQQWISKPISMRFDEVIKIIFDHAKKSYDKTATKLKDVHPLGLQINLQTGVANGVLVARSVGECAELVRGILLNELQFDIEEGVWNRVYNRITDEQQDVFLEADILRERKTKSIYRVVTKDSHLTNTFWNWYLKSS